MKIKVYKLTCKDTPNVIYIGITKVELLLRLFGHLRQSIDTSSENRPKKEWTLSNWRNMDITEIDNSDNEKDARQKESSYILKFMNDGWEVLNNSYRQIITYDMDGNKLDIYSSIHEMSSKTGIIKTQIHRCLNDDKKSFKGVRIFNYNINSKDKIEPFQERSFTKVILQYSLQGDLINEYSSLRKASSSVGRVKSDGIRSCCQGKTYTAHGFVWRYKYGKDYPNEVGIVITRIPKNLFNPLELTIYSKRQNGLFAHEKDFGKKGVKLYSYKELLDIGLLDCNKKDLEGIRECKKSGTPIDFEKFKNSYILEVKKHTWGLGIPMVYVNEKGRLIKHWNDGRIEYI